MLCENMALLLFLIMFEKLSKRFASKATDGAVEGVKETLNDKIDQYGDIIKIGLVLGVIILGTKHLTRQRPTTYSMPYGYLPLNTGYPSYSPYDIHRHVSTHREYDKPIVINNYYQEMERRKLYEQQQYFQKQQLQQRSQVKPNQKR